MPHVFSCLYIVLALLGLCAAPGLAPRNADASPAVFASILQTAGSAAEDVGFLVMGGGREEAALADRGSGEAASLPEQFLSGSFVGALFGYTYTGFGAADMLALALLAFLVFKAARGPADKAGDRFTLHSRGNASTEIPEDFPAEDGFEDGFADDDEAAPRRRRDNPSRSGDSRDNPWSRRMGGHSGASGKESPWTRSEPPVRKPTVRDQADAMWAHLSSKQRDEEQPGCAVGEDTVPADFNVADFLEGARALYVRLQQAWAARQVEELAPFVTPGMLSLLQRQVRKDPEPSTVDIALVNAALQDVKERDDGEEALVHFNVLMRAGDAAQPGEVDEVWRFVRGGDSKGMWRLAGIETP
ncbi:MAG: 39S ribosomal protein L45 [Desulfovibrio sp.]|jgi:hypothetical protein|nr:39S ribosomal protein L45 [Desulfovibrio sp.]